MFVGDEDGGQVLRSAPDGGQALADLTEAETRIHEDARLRGLNIGAIACRTAAKNSELHRHEMKLVGAGHAGKFI